MRLLFSNLWLLLLLVLLRLIWHGSTCGIGDGQRGTPNCFAEEAELRGQGRCTWHNIESEGYSKKGALENDTFDSSNMATLGTLNFHFLTLGCSDTMRDTCECISLSLRREKICLARWLNLKVSLFFTFSLTYLFELELHDPIWRLHIVLEIGVIKLT